MSNVFGKLGNVVNKNRSSFIGKCCFILCCCKSCIISICRY